VDAPPRTPARTGTTRGGDALNSVTPADVVELVAQLVAIDSVNPTLVPGGAGEQEIATFVARWLERAGLEVEFQDATPGRPNVIATVRGRSSGRSLVLNAHTDTVGLSGPDAALEPRIDRSRLYGRGAYDMKGSLAALMLAGAEIAQAPLAGDLIITAVADEEARSVGTEALLHHLRADAAIVAEPTDLRLAIAHKGFVWLEVETKGRAAHGSRYDLGVDSILGMGHVLVALEALDQSLRRDCSPHSLLGGASLHTSLIEGGQELSSYPERCLLKLERRVLPGEAADEVEAQIAAAAGASATVRRLFAREPLETSSAEPIVAALRTSAEQLLDAAPQLVGVPFWTDAALFAAAGIPSILFGPRGEGAHAEIEWVDLGDVASCADVMAATARAFCREPSGTTPDQIE